MIIRTNFPFFISNGWHFKQATHPILGIQVLYNLYIFYWDATLLGSNINVLYPKLSFNEPTYEVPVYYLLSCIIFRKLCEISSTNR